MGERGDWGREHVLDPVMLGRVAAGGFDRALDVGCGERVAFAQMPRRPASP